MNTVEPHDRSVPPGEDTATTDGMPVSPETAANSSAPPDLMKPAMGTDEEREDSIVDVPAVTENEVSESQDDLTAAKASLTKEQDAPSILDMAKALLLFEETPAERLQSDRERIQEETVDAESPPLCTTESEKKAP